VRMLLSPVSSRHPEGSSLGIPGRMTCPSCSSRCAESLKAAPPLAHTP
jgi:hypothetical protein